MVHSFSDSSSQTLVIVAMMFSRDSPVFNRFRGQNVLEDGGAWQAAA
jgi:hypothetical protein